MEDLDALKAQALAAEAQARDFAFLAGDIPVPLCGTAVFPLDLRSLNLLTHAGNRFIVGGTATLEDVRMILWLCSPLHVPVEPPRRETFLGRLWPRCWRETPRTRRQEFIESLPPMDEAAAVAEMRAWIEATFYDAPPRKAAPAGESAPVLEEPVASFIASWVDLLASEYGWHRDEIVGTLERRGIPLPQLYQFSRCCTQRRNPDHPFCSAAVVRIDAEWLREDKPPTSAP